MPLYKMSLAYDGTAYQGWQVQPEGDTIQGCLEAALARMAKEPVRVTGAGRTDAGVHALAQVAHFELDPSIPTTGIVRGLNSMLPRDIRVRSAEEARADFHARYSARSKTYRYHLDPSDVPLPFRSRFALHYPRELDRKLLDEGAAMFVGEHDFAAFRAASCAAKTTTRHVFTSRWLELERELVYEVTATGFLQHMIRTMVGTLLDIGVGKRPAASIRKLIDGGDRSHAGATAAAQGLHLDHVDY